MGKPTWLAAALAVGVAVLGGGPAPAAAQGLYGHALTAEWLAPEVIDSHQVVVGEGVEVPAQHLHVNWEIDLGPSSVRFAFTSTTAWNELTFNGWRFTDANRELPPFGGYRLVSVSAGVAYVEQIVTGYDSEAVWADFGGVWVAGPGDFIELEIDLALFADDFESGGVAAWSAVAP